MRQVPGHPQRSGLFQRLPKVGIEVEELLRLVEVDADRLPLALRYRRLGEGELPELANDQRAVRLSSA